MNPRPSSRLTWVTALLLAALALIEPRAVSAQILHVVIATDDLDPNIGSAVRQDGLNVNVEFFTGVPPAHLNVARIQARALDQGSILAAIAAPNGKRVGPNDALVFYFSGHGAYDEDRGQYLAIPRLDRSIPRDVVRRAVQNSPARLGIILTDCCSSLRPIQFGEILPTPGGAFELTPVMRSLFFDCAGFVDITSSKKGEVSMCKKEFLMGSIFTSSLVGFLSESRDRTVTWEELLERVRDDVAAEFRRDYGEVKVDRPDGSIFRQTTQTVFAFDLDSRPLRGNRNPPRVFGAMVSDHGGDGVVIRSVTAGSPASRVFLVELGVEGFMIPGDVIIEANGRKIRSVDDFVAIVRSSGDVLEGRVRDPRDGRVSGFRADLSSRR